MIKLEFDKVGKIELGYKNWFICAAPSGLAFMLGGAGRLRGGLSFIKYKLFVSLNHPNPCTWARNGNLFFQAAYKVRE
ncbi:hypothetical protein [Paralysiella testudinis]|uniref:Uncharacterized protein n=1 Tax=Paralysiella testudinis TaxID=2809020 RepID=A0A892ZI48_9NEIS|nr:hypothetical protein [Paralysiella testudinis]QRQ82313.1 hypothetical protein JQU52_02545 [Paralysiella testudinis]